jgi:Fic family protein
MTHGLDRLRSGFPLSLRLIREIHEILLSKGRGSGKQPGEFRQSQNWIGGSRPGNAAFVPPPPELVIDCMGKLELFFHENRSDFPVLIRAGLAHVQFETIHPFLDGNGRLGRLLITFMFCEKGVLRDPILYLSLYFKANRSAYYDLLDRVRTRGEWEAWLDFFLIGVRELRFKLRAQLAGSLRSSPNIKNRSRHLAARQRRCSVSSSICSGTLSFRFQQRHRKLASPRRPLQSRWTTCNDSESFGRLVDANATGYSCTRDISQY